VVLAGALAPGLAAVPRAAETEAVASETTDPTAGKPRIEFVSLEHDFGKSASGQDLTTTFEFKNVGDDVLVIEHVKGG
jgi:hypothetical protein